MIKGVIEYKLTWKESVKCKGVIEGVDVFDKLWTVTLKNNAERNEQGKDSEARPVNETESENLPLITDINENDVLCGRGGAVISNRGNISFKKLVKEKNNAYQSAKKRNDKARIANEMKDIKRRLHLEDFSKSPRMATGTLSLTMKIPRKDSK